MLQHTYAGLTFPGGRQEISLIVAEVERQRKERLDIVVGSKSLRVRMIDRQLLMEVDYKGEKHFFPMTRHVFTQICNNMGLRMNDSLYKWLAFGAKRYVASKAPEKHDPTRNWGVWANWITDYFQNEPETKLVRCMRNADGTMYCRAMLSSSYEVIPAADFFYAVFDALKDVGAEIWHARLSEDRFFGYAVSPGITGQVTTDRVFDPGDGWKSRWYGKPGDTVNASMSFSTSETGEGGVGIAQAVLRRVCENYCVWHDLVAKKHIGKRHEIDTQLSTETLKMRNEFFFAQIKDLVKNTFDPAAFKRTIELMNGATQDVVEDAEAASDSLMLVYDIGEERKAAIRELFNREHDFSRYGLVNAVTRFSHEKENVPEVAFALERMGTDLLATDMKTLYAKAEVLRTTKKERNSSMVPGESFVEAALA